MKVLWLLIQFVFGLVIFLGAAAEVASHVLDHGSFWAETYRNVRSLLEPVNSPRAERKQTENAVAAGACLRYEKRVVDMHCDEKEDPGDRYLCKITIPPAERVCVEFAPPG